MIEYTINWHNLISGHSLKETYEMVKSICEDLSKLEKLEREGKIEGYVVDTTPSIQGIKVIDKSCIGELETNALVDKFNDEEEEI